jgi:hypothetical protein
MAIVYNEIIFPNKNIITNRSHYAKFRRHIY